MMTRASEPIVPTAIASWRDALAARERMPMLLWIAMAALFAVLFLEFLLLVPVHLGFFARIVGAAAQAFVMTPLAIAIHRFVLLGETTSVYRIDPSEPRFQKFFLYALGFAVIWLIPQLFRAVLGHGFFGSLIGLIVGIVCAIAAIRLIILFPAVAIDAPDADWRNALEDTKGHSWSVFFTMIAVALPAIVVFGFLLALLRSHGWFAGILLAAVQAAIFAFVWAASVAAASRLYAAYADRLGKPVGVAPRPAT
jgi:hypothetical protein